MPLALAYLAFLLGGSAYAERYTGIALPAFLLLVALGVGLLPDRRIAAGILIVASMHGADRRLHARRGGAHPGRRDRRADRPLGASR